MKDFVSWRFVLATAVILTVAPIVLVRTNFFKRLYVYEGTVADQLESFPLDLVTVSSADSALTYTDNRGFFRIESQRALKEIWAKPLSTFENPKNPINCQPQSEKILTKIYSCHQRLSPQPFDVAARVLAVFNPEGRPDAKVSRAQKERLWNFLSSSSQKLWRDQKLLADRLLPYEDVSRSLKILAISYRVEKTSEKVSDYKYFEQPVAGEVVRVKAKLQLINGKTREKDLFFVREGGLWRYLFEETPQSANKFSTENSWALKGKL